jgi:catechol 2,3-dioxygenase-like lactoylglutathione lyase family enzyme
MHSPIALTGVTLATPLLDETADFYVNRFGLAEGGRDVDEVRLTAVATIRPPVVLRRADTAGLAGLSFAMRSEDALVAAHAALAEAGLGPGAIATSAFTVDDPDGTPVTLHVGEDISIGTMPEQNDRPLFLSHVVLNSRDPERLVAFYCDHLGLRISDAYEKGLLMFMRCDQPQHHCLGISPGAGDGLNHFAMDCGTVDGVMRAISRMHRGGSMEVWGPGRHGPGGNVFCYFEDPTGFVPEFTCDVLQIEDDAAWQPQEWKRTPENGNTWLSGGPTERATALMSGSAFPNAAARATMVATE